MYSDRLLLRVRFSLRAGAVLGAAYTLILNIIPKHASDQLACHIPLVALDRLHAGYMSKKLCKIIYFAHTTPGTFFL